METTMKRCYVTTANMGSCQCGDCYCRVYEDGSIQYTGLEEWQCSERRMPMWRLPSDAEVAARVAQCRPGTARAFHGHVIDYGNGLRHYHSNLRLRDYWIALDRIRKAEERGKDPSKWDWSPARCAAAKA